MTGKRVYDERLTATAKYLEEFARQVDSESHVPMIPQAEDTWVGFVHAARQLIKRQGDADHDPT
jgi:hypothetical protein